MAEVIPIVEAPIPVAWHVKSVAELQRAADAAAQLAADIGRRAALQGFGASLFAAPAIVSAAVAESDPDRELIDACAALHVAYAALKDAGLSDDELDRRDALFFDLARRISTLPPRTAEGMQAKAAAAFVALKSHVASSTRTNWRHQGNALENLALHCLHEAGGRRA